MIEDMGYVEMEYATLCAVNTEDETQDSKING